MCSEEAGVWSTKKLLEDGKWVVPSDKKSARTPFDPVEDVEIPHSSQSTNMSLGGSDKDPDALSDSDELPPPGSIKLYFFDETWNETPPASQSSALALASLPAPPNESAEGAVGPSEVACAPPPAPSQNSSQLSSSYGSSSAFSTVPAPDRVEDEPASLVNPAQSLPTPANNAVERGSSSSNYNCYSHLEAPPSNHIEMPSSSRSRAYPSQPCGYIKMPPSSTSCARAQPAPISCNGRIPCSSPTEIRPYYKSSDNSTEINSSWPKGALYSTTSPSYRHVKLDPQLSPYHCWFKSVEDSNRLAQPHPEPLLSDHWVGPVLNSAQFGQPQPLQPVASSRGTQTSTEPPPFDDRFHAQSVLNIAGFNHPQLQRPEPSSYAIQPYAKPLLFDDRVQRQPALNRAQFDHTRLPRPTISINDIQPYVEPLSFDDRVQRLPASNGARFDHIRLPRPEFSMNDIQPFVEPLPFDDRVQRLPRPAFSMNDIRPYVEPLPFDDRVQRLPALNVAQFGHTRLPRPAVSISDIQLYAEPLPFDYWVQRQQALVRVQFEHPQPPRTVASSRAIQPNPGPLPLGDWLRRQPSLDSAQFEQVRRIPVSHDNLFRLGDFSERSQSYPEQTAWAGPLFEYDAFEPFGPSDPLQPPRIAAAALPDNRVHRLSNDTRTNTSPAYVLSKWKFSPC